MKQLGYEGDPKSAEASLIEQRVACSADEARIHVDVAKSKKMRFVLSHADTSVYVKVEEQIKTTLCVFQF